ncbi:MAG: ABC transporter permease, partial [Salinivirgaceae bacterium]|nr:ABC transporter permease [Salinivirgaceae bacterium]
MMKIIYNIKLFLRIFNKYKSHYLLNIGALAICIASFIILISYTYSQNDYDSFHDKADRIYRVINVRNYPTKIDRSAGCIEIAGVEMKSNLPEVEAYAHCVKRGRLLTINGTKFKEEGIYFATPSFLNMFSFPIVRGDKTDFLKNPYTCLISESLAHKYFGDEDPIGQIIDFSYSNDFVVEGILKDVPPNSYFDFEILASYASVKAMGYCESCNNKNTFLLLREGADKSKLEAKFPALIKQIHSYDDFLREYLLQPIGEMHLTSIYRFEIGKTSDGRVLFYLNIIALLILFISWFNYINVNAIISLNRLKENGIKSIVGAKSIHIFWQSFLESVLFSFIASGLGYVVAVCVLPLVTNLFHIEHLIIPKQVLLSLGGIIILGSFVSTIIPFLTFKKIRAVNLSGLFKFQKNKSVATRTIFIVAQYVIAILLIAFSFLTIKQYNFMVDSELGYNSDNLLVVKNYIPNSYQRSDDEVFLENLLKYPGIEKVGHSSYLFGSENGDVGGGFRMEGNDLEESIQMYELNVSKNFFEMFDIEIISGSGFSRPIIDRSLEPNQQWEVILNEAAVKQLGFKNPNDIIGKTIIRESKTLGTVIGVVKNHHQESLDKPIFPTFYIYSSMNFNFLIKIHPENIAATLKIIEEAYGNIAPAEIFEYFFLNKFFEKQYMSYAGFLKVIVLFTLLGILICCMGMYSLIKYIIQIKTKEIGVRKVNGARTSEMMLMLNYDLMKWILLAFVLACPIAWYAMNKWLENFAYKTPISWWVFALAGLL